MADTKWLDLSTNNGGGGRWDYNANKKMIGIYKGKTDGVGQYKSVVYHFENEEGEKIDVWGTTALNMEMNSLIDSELIAVGDKLMIEYMGEKKNPNTGRTFKNFKVYKAS
jgi:hypothetical protein